MFIFLKHGINSVIFHYESTTLLLSAKQNLFIYICIMLERCIHRVKLSLSLKNLVVILGSKLKHIVETLLLRS